MSIVDLYPSFNDASNAIRVIIYSFHFYQWRNFHKTKDAQL